MQKRLHLLVALLAFMVTTAMARLQHLALVVKLQLMAKTSLAQQSRLFTNLLVQSIVQ